MRNDKWPISIGTIGFRAVWPRMHDGDLFHGNDVDVETTRTEPHRWHATEEPLQFLDAREHLNSRRGRLFWKRCAHLECGVEKLWLIHKANWCGAIERRNLLNAPARNMRECDHRFGERGDRVVKVGPDP
jgi:hypothetical protein